MSASMTSPPSLEKQAESLDILSHFLSINKESVIAAAEESRRQMQLTEEEKKKIEEAKAFIAQHAALDANLRKRENELAIGQAAHKKAVEEHAAHIASENIRLETFASTLTVKQKEQEKIDKQQRAEAERIAAQRIDQERQHRDAIAACQKQEANNNAVSQANISAKAANEAEANRLKEWESKLKAKAQKIREQAADF